MSQFIPYEPFAPRPLNPSAAWRPLGAGSASGGLPPADRTFITGLRRPPRESRVDPAAARVPADLDETEALELGAPPEPHAMLVAREAAREAERALERAEHADALGRLDAERVAMHATLAATLDAEMARLEAAGRTLEAAAAALEGAHATLVAEVRAGAAAVILEAARRIAGDALHADPALLAALVDEASASLGRDGLVVHVSPLDADAVRARLPRLEVYEDFGIEAGCVCVGPAGRIDASLETSLLAVTSVIERWRDAG